MTISSNVVVGLSLIAVGIGLLKAYIDVERWSKCCHRRGHTV